MIVGEALGVKFEELTAPIQISKFNTEINGFGLSPEIFRYVMFVA